MAVKVTVYGTANMRQIESARRELDRLEQTARTAGTGFSGSMTKIGNSLKEAGGKVTDTGKTLTTHLTLPLVGIGLAGVMVAANFDTTMAQIRVSADASAQTMEDLRKLAIKMGADTSYSANDAASAMLELSKGGMRPAEIQAGALASTMALAATEGIDLSEAATYVIQAMNMFGIKAKDTGKVVDYLAGGANAVSANVVDLAAGLKYVGSTAASTRVPIEDTVTALAWLNQTGLDSTTAGTSLNRMLLGIVAPTDKAAAMMDKLGLKLIDAKGQMVPMEEIIRQLQKRVGELGDADRQAALKRMFGVEGMRAANKLIDLGVKGYKKLHDETTRQGIAQDMANARMEGMTGAIEKMLGSLETAALVIGEQLGVTVESVTGFIKDMTDKFVALSPATQKIIAIIGLVVAAIGPLLIVIGALITAAGVVAGAIGAISLPVVAVVAAIAVLVAGVIYAWNNFEWFRTAVGAVWQGIQTAIAAVVDWFKANILPTIQAAIAWLGEQWRILEPVVREVWNGIQRAVQTVAGWFAQYVWPLLQRYLGFIGAEMKILWTVVQYVWGVIQRAIEVFIQWFVNSMWPSLKKGIQFISDAWTLLQLGAQKVWSLITTAVKTFVDWFTANVWPKIKPVVDLIEKGWNRIYPAVKAAWDKVLGFLQGLISTFASIGGQLIDGIKAGFGRAWDAFVGWAKDQVDKLPEAVKIVFGIASPSRVMAEIGGYLVDGMRVGMTQKLPELIDAGRNLAHRFAQSMSEGGKDLSKKLGEDYTAWFDSVVEKLRSKVGEAKAAMQDFAKTTAEAITGSMSFTDAQSGSADRVKAIQDAQQALADAQAKAAAPDATEADRASVGVAQQALTDAQSQGTQLGLTFMQALQVQAERAAEFAARVKTLIAMGLSQAALQQVLAAGVAAGTQIANQLIAGGAGTIATTNELVKTTQDAATKVGDLAGTSYFATGVKTAQDTLAGFKDQFGKGGPGYKKLMGVMDNLAESAKRTVLLDVQVTRNVTEIVSRVDGARAGGGYVQAGSTYLVGELGPELFTPSTTGSIVPNGRLGGGGRQVTIEKGAVQLSVQAPPGSDIGEVVHGIVDEALTRLARELVAA